MPVITGYVYFGLSVNSGLIALIFLLIYSLSACTPSESPEQISLRRYIDSLNSRLNNELVFDSSGIGLVNKILRISDSMDYQRGITESAAAGARIYMLNFQNKKAFELLELANKAMSKTGDIRLEALVNLNYGLFNFRINNYDVALDYYLKSMNLSLQCSDTLIYARSLMNIANLYLENGYFEKARAYFRQSIFINSITNNQENLSIDYHRLSIYHIKQGDLDSASLYLDTAITKSKESGNVLLYIYNLNNMATFQIEKGNYDLGKSYSTEALRLMDSIRPFIAPSSSRSVILANLGLLNLNRKNYKKALWYFETAYTDSVFNIDPVYRINLLLKLHDTHRYLGNHSKAAGYLHAYLKLRDENDRKVIKQNLLDTEMRYNFMQIKQEHEHKQQKMRLLLYVSLIVLGIGIIALVLFIQKQRIKIRNEKLLKNIQEIKLDRLNRELASQALNMVRLNERKANLFNTLKINLNEYCNDFWL